jgi:hypothetical protein
MHLATASVYAEPRCKRGALSAMESLAIARRENPIGCVAPNTTVAPPRRSPMEPLLQVIIARGTREAHCSL